MLHLENSSASSSSGSPDNRPNMSILNRQKSIMLQRLSNLHDGVTDGAVDMHLSHFWPRPVMKHENDHQSIHPSVVGKATQLMSDHDAAALFHCNNNLSSVRSTSTTVPQLDLQWNSNLSKKRKIDELDVEEQGKEQAIEADKSMDGQSEITAKTARANSVNTCSKASEAQKPDYIHVRARRGQATDSHSLAERARREKISKKMKCLQDLVPGCERVTGKAGMLDEIINYVQSLQKQVEFLSMKLAAFNPRHDFSIDSFFAKEIPGFIASQSVMPAHFVEASNSSCLHYNQMQLETRTQGTSSQKSRIISQSSVLEDFVDSSHLLQLQQLSGWDSEWPELFNVSFH